MSDPHPPIDQHAIHLKLGHDMESVKLAGKQLVEAYQKRVAETLLLAGITLIPSDLLEDDIYIVSRGVYDAAVKLAKPAGGG